MQDALVANQARHRLFPIDTDLPITAVIGVSGGADSLFLLHILHSLAPIWKLRLQVAHLDHNLRPDSAADAAFVADHCQRMGLPLHSETVAPGALRDGTGGLENAARAARYAFLCKVAINGTVGDQVPILVVGHHADDQAETVLMNLVRGSGLTGLSGMRWVNHIFGTGDDGNRRRVRLVRPLLNIRRAEIHAYLRENNLSWREDQSNLDPAYTRNHLRLNIMPSLEAINANLVSGLCRTAEILRGEEERVNAIDADHLARLRLSQFESPTGQAHPAARIVLDLDAFQALDSAAQRGTLRQALARLTEGPDTIGFDRINDVTEELESGAPTGATSPLAGQIYWTPTPAGTLFPSMLSLHKRRDEPFQSPYPTIRDRHELPGAKEDMTITVGDQWQIRLQERPVTALPDNWKSAARPWRAYFDADELGRLVLDRPQAGQRIAPLGLDGRHKLLGDLMTDSKIPRALRTTWPLLIDAERGRVLWVCGLRTAHHARIRKETTNVLCLTWQSRRNRTEPNHESQC